MKVNADGWIDGAEIVPSIRHSPLALALPIVTLHHATATTASPEALADKIRGYIPHAKDCPPDCREHDRPASWHLLGGKGGRLWQSVPLIRGAWHCAAPVKAGGLRWKSANRVSISIEWEHPGPVRGVWAPYTDAQRQLWRDLRPALEAWAGPLLDVGHYELEPARRSDPGPEWMAWVRSL